MDNWKQVRVILLHKLETFASSHKPIVTLSNRPSENEILSVTQTTIRVLSLQSKKKDDISVSHLQKWWKHLVYKGEASLRPRDKNCPRGDRSSLVGAILVRCLPNLVQHIGHQIRLIGNVVSINEGIRGLVASDLVEPPADRVLTTTSRIVRDTMLAIQIKVMHEYRCQICSETISLADGSSYAEGHHLKPLGSPHNGPDIEGNIVCLCPNHHAACDFGAIRLDLRNLRQSDGHKLEKRFVDYHNKKIFRG